MMLQRGPTVWVWLKELVADGITNKGASVGRMEVVEDLGRKAWKRMKSVNWFYFQSEFKLFFFFRPCL